MYVLSDTNGVPLLVGASAAHTHNSQARQPMTLGHHTRHDPHRGRHFKPQGLHADKAYDTPLNCANCFSGNVSASASPARDIETA